MLFTLFKQDFSVNTFREHVNQKDVYSSLSYLKQSHAHKIITIEDGGHCYEFHVDINVFWAADIVHKNGPEYFEIINVSTVGDTVGITPNIMHFIKDDLDAWCKEYPESLEVFIFNDVLDATDAAETMALNNSIEEERTDCYSRMKRNNK